MKYLILILISVSFLACDSLFGTRDPEPPNEGTERSLWQQPTSPDIVLENLINSFESRNADDYVKCLSDTTNGGREFLFLPDAETAASNTGIFSGWGVENERQYITLIFSESSLPEDATASLTLSHFEEPAIPSDTASYDEVYDLILHHTLESISTRMKGRAKFRMARDAGGNWAIYYWEDIAYQAATDTLHFPTWSDMKARAQ